MGQKLSDEHYLPYGLGGSTVLKQASCKRCADETSGVERRLLRGHWWPHRHRLNIQSRHKRRQPAQFPATLTINGEPQPTGFAGRDYPFHLIPIFDPPGRLVGKNVAQIPIAARMNVRQTGPLPRADAALPRVVSGQPTFNFPVDLNITDVVRFLAKVAHGFAIARRGRDAFATFFLRDIILGRDTTQANNFIGNTTVTTLPGLLPGTTLHALMEYERMGELSVLVQLFREQGEPPPIYEVIVGRLQ